RNTDEPLDGGIGPGSTLHLTTRPKHAAQCLLLAQSGHTDMSAICPLLEAKRTSASDRRTIAIYEYTPWSITEAEPHRLSHSRIGRASRSVQKRRWRVVAQFDCGRSFARTSALIARRK